MSAPVLAAAACLAPGCARTIAAGRFAPAAPLAAVLCLPHALAATRAGQCLAPGCWARVALPGASTIAGMLCVEHLAAAVRVPAPRLAPPTAPQRPDLRGRCWGERMTCPRPATRRTPHGGFCDACAPTPTTAAVTARQVEPDPDVRDGEDPVRLASALEVIRSLGGQPIRTEATYGTPSGWGCTWTAPKKPKPGEAPDPHGFDAGRLVDWDAVEGLAVRELVPGRAYARAAPEHPPLVPARRIGPAEIAYALAKARDGVLGPAPSPVPRTAATAIRAAATAGWSTRSTYAAGWQAVRRAPVEPDAAPVVDVEFDEPVAPEPPSAPPEPGVSPRLVESVVLRAWRGPLLVAATWRRPDGAKWAYAGAWLVRGRRVSERLGARELTALLKAPP